MQYDKNGTDSYLYQNLTDTIFNKDSNDEFSHSVMKQHLTLTENLALTVN